MDSMGHVNNVMYVRYAESARVNWAWNYAVHIDPGNRREWIELCTPKGDGLILKSIGVEYKFVRAFVFPMEEVCGMSVEWELTGNSL
jgi:hypothetical protein